MKNLDEKDNNLSFHLQLLSNTINVEKYPFTQLIINNGISKHEYDDIMYLLHRLESQLEEQKEEGLLNYTSLLIHFAGMLHEKLNPTETIYALYKEGYYPTLLLTFIKILEET